MFHELRRMVVFAWLGALGAPFTLQAGPLNPPAGPVTSTQKTLQEVEPRIVVNAVNCPTTQAPGGPIASVYTISQPGSYYLTENLVALPNRHGIVINANDVTLDLNGFEINGAGSTGNYDGVYIGGNRDSISIHNGSVRGWARAGVNLTFASDSRIEDVRAGGNAGVGIATGGGSSIVDCSVSGNTGGGIAAGSGSVVSRCTAWSNTGTGITCNFTVSVSECSVTEGQGIGIDALTGCRIDGCTVNRNALDGIRVDRSCIVSNNVCWANGLGSGNGANIHAILSYNRIEGNNCQGADRGIDVDGPSNIIIRNTCSVHSGLSYDIVAGNAYGTIIDITNGPPLPAVSGSSAPSTLGTTDPNANFTLQQ